MNTRVIGIAGNKGAGKDTVANMLLYLMDNGTRANYNSWAVHNLPFTGRYADRRVTHFADPLKDMLAALFNINREFFNDRIHKDETYYCTDIHKFVTKIDARRVDYKFINLIDMEKYGLSYLLLTDKKCFKLRTLLQYFGTSIGRNILGSDIWVKSTNLRILDKLDRYGICIVPDVRFGNEAQLIHTRGGQIVYVDRQIDVDNHESELIDFKSDIVIKNDSSLMNLFYKVLDIYKYKL